MLREHLDIEIDENIHYSKINWDLTPEELRDIALTKTKEKLTAKQRKADYYIRSQVIKLYALKRANGYCESCGSDAPFLTETDKPYLEVHYISKLADGGPDDPLWVVALCPNCHRRAHYGKEIDEFSRLLSDQVVNKEKKHGFLKE